MRLDPAAAARRKDRARQDAHVRVWQEDSGNAGLSARQVPAAEAVIAWQNIERRALDLHAAGIEGTAGQLQVQAVLDFLLGRAAPGQDARPGTHQDAAGSACQGTHHGAEQGACPDTHDSAGEGACQDAHAEPGYTPSRALRHLIQARNARCAAPGCGRPAAACDLDHTIAWDDSHLTCECNIAPKSKR
jgi:hypothetical protein